MHAQDIVTSFAESAKYIQSRLLSPTIDLAIVLGSGLSDFTQILENPTFISYQDIPNFPKTQVEGHGHQLVYGSIGDKKILLFSGRFHYYQGLPITTVAIPAWISYYMNIPRYVATNAAGGVNVNYQVGDLTLIKDHINPTGLNPLRGVQLDNWQNPFFDTSNLYNERLRESILKVAIAQGFSMKQGTSCFLPGPNFETPAEIEMLRTLGADLVGMSTVPETLTAHKLGMKVLAMSVVTNVYPKKNESGQQVSHQEVLEATTLASKKLHTLMKDWITLW
ncbi:MAG: purine-nucleoside phosphorylase [Bdellovibrionota bacterium]